MLDACMHDVRKLQSPPPAHRVHKSGARDAAESDEAAGEFVFCKL
jgi:hypothetical protein